MNEVLDLETYWSKELGETIEIVPRGWVHSPEDFALYVSGVFVISFKHLDEIEDYLARYFMVQG